MGGRKKKSNSSLGNALVNAKETADRSFKQNASKRHSERLDAGTYTDQSVTEESSLDDFLRTAQLAGTEFTAERQNMKIIPMDTSAYVSKLDSIAEDMPVDRMEQLPVLTIPRRPPWSSDTTPDELDEAETESFLEWRRQLAIIETNEKLAITPFEKNLNFWRQLWRVIERSDIILQIVDSRHPLLFRCQDLEKYAKEVNGNKQTMIVMNKADLLTQAQRKGWAEYFDTIGVRIVFFSAVDESSPPTAPNVIEKLLNSPATIPEETGSLDEVGSDTDTLPIGETVAESMLDCDNPDSKNVPTANIDSASADVDDDEAWETDSESDGEDASATPEVNTASTLSHNNASHIHTPTQLIEMLKSIQPPSSDQLMVGMIGYPNVGKSSIINTLIGTKRVSVSATPGKTKHYQTIPLEPGLTLCDCPGLVMPSIAVSRAHMLLLGILPVDQMRDPLLPVSLVSRQIPAIVFEKLYGLSLPKYSSDGDCGSDRNVNEYAKPQDLLTSLAYIRGWMGPKGTTDWGRAGRYLVKDYIAGRFRYAFSPPGQSDVAFNSEIMHVAETLESERAARRNHGKLSSDQADPQLEAMRKHRLLNMKPNAESVDAKFFDKKQAGFSIKSASGPNSLGQATCKADAKKSRRHPKKDKLRRIYKDLDSY